MADNICTGTAPVKIDDLDIPGFLDRRTTLVVTTEPT